MSLAVPGQPLTIFARDWNDIQSMLSAWRAGRFMFSEDEIFNSHSSLVWVKNESQSEVTAGDVLGLGDPVIAPTDDADEFKARFAFKGAIPSTSTPHYGKYGVVQEPAEASNGYCRCVVAGVTFVKLNITHADDRGCEISNGVSTSLITGYVGTSRILWKSSGTGSSDKWGLIRIGDALDQFFGKPNATITSGSSGTVNVWSPDFSGSALGPTVANCYNHASTSLTTSDKVAGTVVNGIAVISKISC